MRPCLFAPLTAVIVLSALVLPVRAQSGSVVLRVDPIDDIQKEVDDGQVNSRTTRTPQVTQIAQKRYLRITLTNRLKEKVSDLRVRYFLFSYDLNDGEVKLFLSSTLGAALDPSATQVLESAKAVTMYYPPRLKSTWGIASTDRTPARGMQQAGYGVQVLKGKTLLAETYSSPEIKQHVERHVGKRTN
jgi:hypothetical protein